MKLGGKTTVGAGCIIGPGTAVGDKGSVKRSVVGSDCRIGSNAKVTEISCPTALCQFRLCVVIVLSHAQMGSVGKCSEALGGRQTLLRCLLRVAWFEVSVCTHRQF